MQQHSFQALGKRFTGRSVSPFYCHILHLHKMTKPRSEYGEVTPTPDFVHFSHLGERGRFPSEAGEAACLQHFHFSVSCDWRSNLYVSCSDCVKEVTFKSQIIEIVAQKGPEGSVFPVNDLFFTSYLYFIVVFVWVEPAFICQPCYFTHRPILCSQDVESVLFSRRIGCRECV